MALDGVNTYQCG